MDKPLKIFVVEDEIIAAESLIIDLKKFGYEVVGNASNKKEALQKILLNIPNLILMDIKLKDEDGVELTEELHRLTINPIPVVYLTAYADQDTIQRAIKSSPYGFISKPYKLETLQATINIAINKYREFSSLKNQLDKEHEKLEALSKLDPLTQLPNQFSLVENFNGILEVFYQQANTNENFDQPNIPSLIPIFYLDFKRLMVVKDELGLDVSNALFKALSKRLKANIDSDTVIARLENYEFCLISPPIISRQVAIDLAKSLLETITPPFIYKGEDIYIDFNIGISFYPVQGYLIHELLGKAQKAVKVNEKFGLNQYQVYSNALHNFRKNEISIEAELHKALAREEFELFYQPKVDIKTNKIIGAEALLRWNNSTHKFISPDVFIPIAEEIGLIDSIGEWVLNTACQQFNDVIKQYGEDLFIAINFSARQFNNTALNQTVFKILANNCFNVNLLEIELTESILVNNPALVAKKLTRLKSSGLKIAVDDFGKGYSSLSYLQNFYFDILKIDRCFIKDIDSNITNASIVRYLIELSHKLGVKVVAEGVETKGELEFLTTYNCDAFQGYLFSRPLAFSDFKRFIFSHRQSSLS